MPTFPATRLLTVVQAAEEYAPVFTVRSLRAMIADRSIGVHRVHGRVFLRQTELDRVIRDGYTEPRQN